MVKDALKKKIASQSSKKAMKNRAMLPRTAGLRTLSELTTEMTKAGLDPSRIQERAEMLAKVQGAKRKRQREEDEAEMDVDEEMGDESGEGDYVDHLQQPGNTKKRKVPANMSGSAHGHDSASAGSGAEDEPAERGVWNEHSPSEHGRLPQVLSHGH